MSSANESACKNVGRHLRMILSFEHVECRRKSRRIHFRATNAYSLGLCTQRQSLAMQDGALEKLVQKRYAGWTGLGAKIEVRASRGFPACVYGSVNILQL